MSDIMEVDITEFRMYLNGKKKKKEAQYQTNTGAFVQRYFGQSFHGCSRNKRRFERVLFCLAGGIQSSEHV